MQLSIDRAAQLFRVKSGTELPGDRDAVSVADVDSMFHANSFEAFVAVNHIRLIDTNGLSLELDDV